ATRILLTVTDSATHHVVCQTTTGIRDALMAKNHAIDLTQCPKLTSNKYTLTIVDPDANSADMLYNTQTINQGTFQSLNSITISRPNASSPFTMVSQWSSTLYV